MNFRYNDSLLYVPDEIGWSGPSVVLIQILTRDFRWYLRHCIRTIVHLDKGITKSTLNKLSKQ